MSVNSGKGYTTYRNKKYFKEADSRVPKATKQYVDKKVKQGKWSKQNIATVDFDETLIQEAKYNLSRLVMREIIANNNAILKQGSNEVDTDGLDTYNLKVKYDAIKWQIRYTLGENETSSAVSEVVREIIWRTEQNYEEVDNPSNIDTITDDHDGSIKYLHCYGGVKGVVSDRMHYLMSQAADGDTTVGGCAISKGFKKLKYVDTMSSKVGTDDTGTITSENGQLVATILSDDPSGENGKMYGYIQIFWRYLKN